MATRLELDGWNVHVDKFTIEANERNELTEDQPGFKIVFTEVAPDSGNIIIFGCGQRVADYLVRELSGVGPSGLHIPKL